MPVHHPYGQREVPSPFQEEVALCMDYAVKQGYGDNPILTPPKVNEQKAGSSCGPPGHRLCEGQACFALGSGRTMASGIAGQKHSILKQNSRYKACTLTQTLILAILS